MLRIEAFGGLGFRIGADLLPEGRIQRRQQSLLVVLATAGEAGLSREKLLALLWPESPDERARHSLKQTIYLLRRAVSDDDVVLGRELLRLNPAVVSSDVGDFDAACARADFATAAHLYRGPLLDGVHLFDSVEWERWVDGARERYAALQLRALNALAEAGEASGSPAQAVSAWRRLAQADPYSSRVTAQLMRALERAGDHAAALRVAEEHAARLRQELEAEPDAELAALAERIRRQPLPREVVRGAPPPAATVPDPSLAHAPEEQAPAPLQASTATPRRRRGRLVAGLVVVAGVLGAIPLLTGGRADRATGKLDDHAVAVLPFRVDASDPKLAYLREGLVDLLGSLLADADVHALDTRTVLAAVRAEAAPPGADLPRERALHAARSVGAGQLLLGEVVGIPSDAGKPPRLILTASLLRAADGRLRARARAEAPADSLGPLVERVAGQLLFEESGDAEHRAPFALSTSLPALRAYLAGQEADRRFDGAAVDHFLHAIELDSTFALAALRLHLALSWAVDRQLPPGVGERALWIAWNHRDHLSQRDRAILTVRTGPKFPALTGIPGILEYQEDAARRFPEEPEVWLELAETYFHSGALLGMTDWRERFKAAAENALRLDLAHARREALPHLIAVYGAEGDSAQLRRLRRLHDGDVPMGATAVAAREPSPAPADWRARLDSLPLPALALLVRGRVTAGADLERGEAAVSAMLRRAATPAERDAALGQQVFLALARGRPNEALQARRALLDAAPDQRRHRTLLVRLLYDALYDDGDAAAAAAAADELESSAAADTADSPAVRSLQGCALAQWRLAHGQTRGVEQQLAALRVLAPQAPPFTEEILLPFRQRACAAVVQAWLAVLQNRADAGALLERADLSLRTELPLWLIGYPELYAGNIAVARLFARRGDVAHALAAIRRHSYGTNAPTFLPTFAREQGRLAAAAGERDEAIKAYRYYLALRSDAEPSLRPQVERVRAELDRVQAAPASH